MRVLFLSYWGIEDGLTKSTVLPHVSILRQFHEIEEVFLSTIERDLKFETIDDHHIPLRSRFKGIRAINKLYDFYAFPRILSRIIHDKNIDLLICRGAPAGAIGHLVNKINNVKYIVESFEPHAEYMLESKVWSASSLSYRLEKKWEKEQVQSARYIVTVSDNYRKELIERYQTEKKFKLGPCAVQVNDFQFSPLARNKIREQLGFSEDDIIGIYVGKFGGLYLDEEAFKVFAEFLNQNEKNKLLVLTPQNKVEIQNSLGNMGISGEKFRVLSVDHTDVPNYLSASDAAFALYKPTESKKALSPIKIGEYWANGLPVLIPSGIGDDSEIIFSNQIGTEIDLARIHDSVVKFMELLGTKNRVQWKETIEFYAREYRSFDRIKQVYTEIIQDLG